MSADLIVFGEDWGSHPSSTQHIIGQLASERRVLWVNSIGMRQPRLGMTDLGRAARKIGRAMGRATAASCPPAAAPGKATATYGAATGAPLRIVQPLILPMVRSTGLRALNRALLARSVGGAARACGLRRPVMWTSLPSAIDAVGALGEAAVVYYCGDDFGALAGVDHAAARRLEEELADRADLILAASAALAARFPAGKTRLLPHGVDQALFGTPAPRACDMPGGAPVAGFYGALAPWLDLEMIAGAARLLPHWRFVMIGPAQTDLAPLLEQANISLMGPRPHAALPGYAQHWNAGMIPFRNNAQIQACNPLKLREYLAAGRPIVSTDFPALREYAGDIAVVDSAAGLAAALQAALHDDAGAVARRQRSVAGESWQARAAYAASLIDRLAA